MRKALLLPCLFVVPLAVAAAQQAPVFRSAVHLVPVFATVTKADGSFAQGLTRDDFVVLDNGKPQEVVSFSSEAQAISVSVILDTSASMAATLPRVFRAGIAFLDQLQPEDRAMVGSLVYVGPPMTSDKSRLRTSLDLLPRDPWSPLWAALDRSLTTLKPENNRRVIVIYTDGQDDPGQMRVRGLNHERILSRVESESVMVYAIGFEGAAISKPMKAIATRSGGRATELKSNDNLATALQAVADELHHQYLLGFTPAVLDGSIHKVDVQVRTAGLTVRARQSYVAVK
jgi:Ca-activated chloride channel family protein